MPTFGDATVAAQGVQHQESDPLILPQASRGDEPLTYVHPRIDILFFGDEVSIWLSSVIVQLRLNMRFVTISGGLLPNLPVKPHPFRVGI